MKKFEYKTYKVPTTGTWSYRIDIETLEKELTALGKQGWEATTSFATNTYEKNKNGSIILLKKETNY